MNVLFKLYIDSQVRNSKYKQKMLSGIKFEKNIIFIFIKFLYILFLEKNQPQILYWHHRCSMNICKPKLYIHVKFTECHSKKKTYSRNWV